MEENDIIDQTITFVRQTLKDSEKGHDWFHILRVYGMANRIAAIEPGDKLVIRLAALLHDIADSKFHGGDETLGPARASAFLKNLGLPDELVVRVIMVINNISYSSGLDREKQLTPELAIVQDADRLDAVGAIGIARAFHYGGYKDREIFNPEIPPRQNLTRETYKKSDSPTLNHFYEKLLLLKDQMNTPTGKKLAESRHAFLELYLKQFYAEWNEDDFAG